MKRVCCLALAIASLLMLVPGAAHADGGAPNLAYVAGTARGISVIDVARQEVTRTFAAYGDPRTILLSPDARLLYETEPAFDQVRILAVWSGQTLCLARVPGQPSLLALDPGSNTLYAAGNGSARVSALDASNCAIKRTLSVAGAVYGLAVGLLATGAVGGAGNQIWVSDTTSVTIFDATGQQVARIAVAGGPQYITVPTGYVGYVTSRSGNVYAIDLQTHLVSPSLLLGRAFGPMDYDALTGEIYVPDTGGQQVDVLAPFVPGSPQQEHQPIRRFGVNGAPQSIAITNDGQLGFVALSGGNVTMLDIPGRKSVSTIFVGGTPRFIIAGPYPPAIASFPQVGPLPGQPVGLTLFSMLMLALAWAGIILWVGAQLWLNFVLIPLGQHQPEERATNLLAQQRFVTRFSLPTLLAVLLASVGVLLARALDVTGGQLDLSLSPRLLSTLIADGSVGNGWTMRAGVLLLAGALALYTLLFKKRPGSFDAVVPWANLLLGLALCVSVVLPAEPSSAGGGAFAVLVALFRLLSAAFWLGGTMYLAAVYVPVLGHVALAQRARSLVAIVSYSAPWLAGAAALVVASGLFGAPLPLPDSWAGLLATEPGRVLAASLLLLAALLFSLALHIGLLRPAVSHAYRAYASCAAGLAAAQAVTTPTALTPAGQAWQLEPSTAASAWQLELCRQRLLRHSRLLVRLLYLEALLSAALVLCLALMSVLAAAPPS